MMKQRGQPVELEGANQLKVMNDQELIKWLRQNSSGIYRPSLDAAERLEELIKERENTMAALQDPLAVMINTNRGTIAKMSDADVKAVYYHLFDESPTTNAKARETRAQRSHALRLEDNRPVKH